MVGADLEHLANEAALLAARRAHQSLGVTLAAPETDRFSYDKQSLLARIKVATGGRTAEELVFGEETTALRPTSAGRPIWLAPWLAASG
jgi:YD repeat-containing protein